MIGKVNMNLIQEYESLMASLSATQQEVALGHNEISNALKQVGQWVRVVDQAQEIKHEFPKDNTENGLLICSQCKKPIKPGAKFCPFCGSPSSPTLDVKSVENENQVSPAIVAPIPDDTKTQVKQTEAGESQDDPSMNEGRQTSTRYCPYCGAILSETGNFCGKCGRFLDQADPSEADSHENNPDKKINPTKPDPVENIIAVLPPATQRSGFLGVKADGFILALTQTHILFAQQTPALLKEQAQKAKTAAKQEGKGFFGQMGAQIGSYSGQRYLAMQPEEIMRETSGNYKIPNQQVRSIRLRETTDDEGRSRSVRMTLRSDNSKLEFTFNNANKKQLKKLLQQTLQDTVR